MKRFHVHVAVEKLDDSLRFHSSLCGVGPVLVQPDYAKWMLEEPRVNLAISQRGRQPGINHLGFQVESDTALKAMREPLEAANASLLEHTGATCCYALSYTYWVTDPQGVAWETFHTLDTIPMYGEDSRAAAMQGVCCIPLAPSESQGEPAACCIPLPENTGPGPDKACCA
jgi:hypothetical protein